MNRVWKDKHDASLTMSRCAGDESWDRRLKPSQNYLTSKISSAMNGRGGSQTRPW
jgi:hypothetical protein